MKKKMKGNPHSTLQYIEDAALDITIKFMSKYNRLPTFKIDASFGAYLKLIMLNVLYNDTRKHEEMFDQEAESLDELILLHKV